MWCQLMAAQPHQQWSRPCSVKMPLLAVQLMDAELDLVWPRATAVATHALTASYCETSAALDLRKLDPFA
jgi:hypothetical protein